jgi:RNA polymerase sigma-70 factor (ECF subfamily)
MVRERDSLNSGPDFGWLIEATRQGDREAFGQLAEACKPYLRVIAHRHLHPELRAKLDPSDLMQETFLKTQPRLAHFHGSSKGELLAWLRAILRNHLSNVHRHFLRARVKEVPLEDLANGIRRHSALVPGADAEVEAREMDRELEKALAWLPEHYRRVLDLRYQEGRSFKAIGRATGRSAAAARMVWVRALEKLQQALEGRPDYCHR